jgi:hypothetical protein
MATSTLSQKQRHMRISVGSLGNFQKTQRKETNKDVGQDRVAFGLSTFPIKWVNSAGTQMHERGFVKV